MCCTVALGLGSVLCFSKHIHHQVIHSTALVLLKCWTSNNQNEKHLSIHHQIEFKQAQTFIWHPRQWNFEKCSIPEMSCAELWPHFLKFTLAIFLEWNQKIQFSVGNLLPNNNFLHWEALNKWNDKCSPLKEEKGENLFFLLELPFLAVPMIHEGFRYLLLCWLGSTLLLHLGTAQNYVNLIQ